jgi:hypothetical protein
VIPLLILLRRLPAFASLAAGLLGAILALAGCLIAAAAGSGPSPGVALAIVVGIGAASALLARYIIWRISWFGLAVIVARRLSRLARRR